MTAHSPEGLSPFHLAFPVDDIDQAREFYGGLLGCQEGRSDTRWVDFDFFGHQLVAHQKEAPGDASGASPTSDRGAERHNPVDGHEVPIPHFGVVLPWDTWQALASRLTEAGVRFDIEPYIRFAGAVGEQATMFFRDPSGNALEFKSFKDPTQLFAK
jgi:extradiol dioxygenase family protein